MLAEALQNFIGVHAASIFAIQKQFLDKINHLVK